VRRAIHPSAIAGKNPFHQLAHMVGRWMTQEVTKMTEAEWLGCTKPDEMAVLLEKKVSDRKWWLCGCALFRRSWHRLNEETRKAVQITEALADEMGQASSRGSHECVSIEQAWEEAEVDWDKHVFNSPFFFAFLCLDFDTQQYTDKQRAIEEWKQAQLIRDLVGPLPFRAKARDEAWLAWNNGTVAKLAETTYAERSFDVMPILADALSDAGCTDSEILDHCRRPAEHILGCWVLDFLLGRA
jgi:hypothetical protein